MELYVAISFVVGLIFGLIIPRRSNGVLKIDHSNPEKDIYRFDVGDLDSLNKKSRIVLKIDHYADLSQN